MAERDPQAVTLSTLHEDLTTGFSDVKTTLTDVKTTLMTTLIDVKTTLIVGFRSLPSRESSEEMVRLLREANQLQEGRFTQLDFRIREQHLEVQQVLHAMVDGQRLLAEDQRSLSADIKALVSRLDALIQGRGNGSATAP